MSNESERSYCSVAARTAGAALIGTAETVELWVLLEYGAAWRARALSDNELPAEVNAWLAAVVPRLEGEFGCKARLLFIRQPGREGLPPQLLIVRSGTEQRFVRRIELADHAALANLDPIALVRERSDGRAGRAGRAGRTLDLPLYLVCTNGQRDLCCARFGLPVYDALVARFGASVWQCTHLGGHRYAPNLLCLPEGLLYGFAEPAAAVDLVLATQRGEVVPAQLRGRSCLSAAAQVAELEVRRRTGQYFLDALRLVAEQRLADGRLRISFEVSGHGRHQVVVRVLEPLLVHASCADTALKAVPQFAAEQG